MVDDNQIEQPPEPEAEFIIRDLEILKAVTDSRRLQILGLLRHPCTVKQVAAELKLAPGKLYYHINMLEERGLIRVISTRVVSGIIEKHYQVVAIKFRTDPALLAFTNSESGESGMDVYLNSLLEATRSEIIRGVKAGLIKSDKSMPRARSLFSARGLINLTPAEAEAVYKQLADIITDLEAKKQAKEEKPPDTDWYGLTMLMYPTISEPDKE